MFCRRRRDGRVSDSQKRRVSIQTSAPTGMKLWTLRFRVDRKQTERRWQTDERISKRGQIERASSLK